MILSHALTIPTVIFALLWLIGSDSAAIAQAHVTQATGPGVCTEPHIDLRDPVIGTDTTYFACQTICAEDLNISGGENVVLRAGTTVAIKGSFCVAQGAVFTAELDPCALAPAPLVSAIDADALSWIQAAAAGPAQTLIVEPFQSDNLVDYPDLSFGGSIDFSADETGDFFVRFTGTPGAPAEVQTLDTISPHAGHRIRAWFRFRHLTPRPTTDSTLGLERFDLDLAGGFFGCGEAPNCIDTTCLSTCEEAKSCFPNCDPDPCAVGSPTPCTPEAATAKAHFALLFDLDQPQATAMFADGSACGHLPCSPWGDLARFVEQSGDLANGWHVLFLEYRPEPGPFVAFCLDGNRLADGGISEALTRLIDLLATTMRPLRLRVSANVEESDLLQQVELDWFALQGMIQ